MERRTCRWCHRFGSHVAENSSLSLQVQDSKHEAEISIWILLKGINGSGCSRWPFFGRMDMMLRVPPSKEEEAYQEASHGNNRIALPALHFRPNTLRPTMHKRIRVFLASSVFSYRQFCLVEPLQSIQACSSLRFLAFLSDSIQFRSGQPRKQSLRCLFSHPRSSPKKPPTKL